MDSLKETLLSQLECPVCKETFDKPIFTCTNGHLVCGTCKVKLDNPNACPTCREIGLYRNTNLEKICETVFDRQPIIKCKYTDCEELITYGNVKLHSDTCKYNLEKYKCIHCKNDTLYTRESLIYHIIDTFSMDYDKLYHISFIPSPNVGFLHAIIGQYIEEYKRDTLLEEQCIEANEFMVDNRYSTHIGIEYSFCDTQHISNYYDNKIYIYPPINFTDKYSDIKNLYISNGSDMTINNITILIDTDQIYWIHITTNHTLSTFWYDTFYLNLTNTENDILGIKLFIGQNTTFNKTKTTTNLDGEETTTNIRSSHLVKCNSFSNVKYMSNIFSPFNSLEFYNSSFGNKIEFSSKIDNIHTIGIFDKSNIMFTLITK